jgi:hypothetical protein
MYSNHKSNTYNIIVVRTRLGQLLYVDCDEDYFPDTEEEAKKMEEQLGHVIGFDFQEMILGGITDLENSYGIIKGFDLIPNERGVYKCKVEHESYESNTMDGNEWESYTEIVDFEKICSL